MALTAVLRFLPKYNSYIVSYSHTAQIQPELCNKIDIAILDYLQHHRRCSNVELAKQVSLSPCLERVKHLEANGYMKVTLDRTTSDVFDNFKDALIKNPEVAECHMVAGGFDYLVKLRFSDMPQYRVVVGQLMELPGVAQTHTYMVIEDVKEDAGVHLL